MPRILVVDDDAPSRMLLAGIFEARGYHVAQAADGHAALESARAEPPDLIISDVFMPGMDGFLLCQAWMGDERLREVPFLFYTAVYTSETDREFALSLGAAAYLVKPHTPDQLVAAVQAQLGEDARRVPAQPPLDEATFRSGRERIVGRKLETKIFQVEELSRAYESIQQDYRLLFTANPQPMWIYDLDSLCFLDVNEAAVAHYGYARAEWLAMRITDIRPSEEVSRLLENIQSRRAHPFSRNEIWTHIKKDGTRIQVEIAAHSMQFRGRNARVVTALDVTRRLAAERRELAQLHRIEEAMQGTVTAMTRVVELRDPYTAGHERRVAALSVAIADEFGFDAERREGMMLGASVHDIGKIAIPADMLSKPGKLTDIEYEYIKSHATAGYELLKDIVFPWPLAEMTYQHHERMDGSGYPRGLQGDEILLEARILAVADTVEAMASHRPYRPAHEIATALAEIERHAGTRYDPDVASACLRLFREKGYQFPD